MGLVWQRQSARQQPVTAAAVAGPTATLGLTVAETGVTATQADNNRSRGQAAQGTAAANGSTDAGPSPTRVSAGLGVATAHTLATVSRLPTVFAVRRVRVSQNDDQLPWSSTRKLERAAGKWTPTSVTLTQKHAATGTAFSIPTAALWDNSSGHVVSPGTPVVRPRVCPHCGATMAWEQGRLKGKCGVCFISVCGRVRQVAQPQAQDTMGEGEGIWFGAAGATDISNMARVLAVADFLYATVRVEPGTEGQFVIVSRAQVPVARLATARARWWRAQLLLQWQAAAGGDTTRPLPRWNEGDVSAFILAAVLTGAGLESLPHQHLIPSRFRGDAHVFPPMDEYMRYEAGKWAPAQLPVQVELKRFDPATSLYQAPLEFHRGDLDWRAFSDVFAEHPDVGFTTNRTRFGYPQFSSTPPVSRSAAPTSTAGTVGAGAAALIAAEVAYGAAVDVTEDEDDMVLRRARFSALPKDTGGFRGIFDLSHGVDSVNSSVERLPLFRARFASLTRILGRVLYLQQQRPGVPVVLFKIDGSKAYKRIPLAVAEYHRCAHGLGTRVFVDTRAPMGGVGAADFASENLGMIADKLAELGIFSELWVDDQIFVAYEDTAHEEMAIALALWRRVNWPYGEDKLVWPSTAVAVLGVLVDTVAGTCAVTPERRAKLVTRITEWLQPTATASPRDFSKLAGALEWCTMLLPLSKVYMRLLYRNSGGPSERMDIAVPVAEAVKEELRWFVRVLQDLTAVASFVVQPNAPTVTCWTDAATHGFGAVCKEQKEVMYGEWSAAERECSGIAHWEGAAICLAVGVWGQHAQGGRVVVYTDSGACEGGFTRAKCPDERFFSLLRLLSLLQMRHRCEVQLRWLSSEDNWAADPLSRGKPAPPALAHYRRVHPTPALREMAGLLHSQSLLAASQAHGSTTPLWTTLGATVASVATQSQLPQPWTLSNRRKTRTVRRRLDAYGTSQHGSGSATPSSQESPCPSTSAPSARPVPCASTGGSSAPQSPTPISTATGRHRASPASGSLPPSSSSEPCSATAPSTLACVRRLFWLTPRSYERVSTHRRQLMQHLARRLYVCVTSSSAATAPLPPCASPTASPTCTTRGAGCTSWLRTTLASVLSRHCATTCAHTRPAASRIARCSSDAVALSALCVSRPQTSRKRSRRMQRLLDWTPTWSPLTPYALVAPSNWRTRV